MSKKVTVYFHDLCLTSYFRGHHRPVLQRPVDGSTTRKELYSGLLFELAQGVIDWQIEQNGLNYDAIRQAVKNCLYFADHCKDNDILFPELEKYEELESDDFMCHAYFVIDWSDEE